MNKALACGPKGPKAHLALVEKWKDVPDGTPVIVTKDDGSEFKTKKRSIPWILGRDLGPPEPAREVQEAESLEGIGSPCAAACVRSVKDESSDRKETV